MIVFELADAFTAVIHAALWWFATVCGAVAFVGAVCAFAAGPLIAPGMKTAQKRVSGRVTASSPAKADREPRGSTNAPHARTELPVRRVPAWAHTDHHEEAA